MVKWGMNSATILPPIERSSSVDHHVSMLSASASLAAVAAGGWRRTSVKLALRSEIGTHQVTP